MNNPLEIRCDAQSIEFHEGIGVCFININTSNLYLYNLSGEFVKEFDFMADEFTRLANGDYLIALQKSIKTVISE